MNPRKEDPPEIPRTATLSAARRIAAFTALLTFAFAFSSCESTLDYGYFVGELDVASIERLFRVADEAIGQQDIVTYRSLFGPNYVSVDSSDYTGHTYHRSDYLDFARTLFEQADYIDLRTSILSIQFIIPGKTALVKTHEEEMRKVHGNIQHFTSLSEVEVGFDQGWAYFNRSERTASQTISD